MTALTLPSPAPASRRTRWLLRLHRPALCTWAALVLVLGAALLWLWGPLTDAAAQAWRQYNACGLTARCSYDQAAILRYKDLYQYTTLAVLAVPFLTAAWAGGGLTGRELETGTARLAWTQSVSPVRWLATALTVPAVLVTAGTTLLVWLHRLVWTAGEGRIDTADRWYDILTFYANGPLTVALALAGLVVGALAGLLLRRALAALFTGAVALAALWAAVGTVLPHLWPSVTRVTALGGDGPAGAGITVDEGLVTAGGAHVARPLCGIGAHPSCAEAYARLDAVGYYRDYHPRAHYWPLQLTATGLLAAVTVLLTVAAFWLLRRRTATAAVRRRGTA
ncbi:hypothetical protein GCM10010129_75820 [Streptomyces fumigatiscleroticus]|nr:hypothetical protein GCM10010129_75820 [Streptomyces fumigatiscleroticus]